jgi:hypothetical protein
VEPVYCNQGARSAIAEAKASQHLHFHPPSDYLARAVWLLECKLPGRSSVHTLRSVRGHGRQRLVHVWPHASYRQRSLLLGHGPDRQDLSANARQSY